jgi:large conductance mechanosensitive channel
VPRSFQYAALKQQHSDGFTFIPDGARYSLQRDATKGDAVLKEFRAFIAKGNVLDLAVAVIIGAAFAKIVTSLTDDIIMPIIGKIFGGLDFTSHFILLGPVPADYHGSMTDYAALKKAGAPVLGWGSFLTEVVSFVILAFIIFLMIKAASKAMRKGPDEAGGPTEVELLTQIRDELKKR